MPYTVAFNEAINHAMLYEVGGFWKLTDEVRAGLISTSAQRRAVGYVNDPHDRGGETKYGIAKNANKDLDIAALDWDAACRVYYKRYWLSGDCDNINVFSPRLAVLHFDGCVNHGVGRASRYFQRAAGAIEDGDVGPNTLRLASARNDIDMCNVICDTREAFYRRIVVNDPTQGKYLNGWIRRITEMRAFTTNTFVNFR